MHKEIEILAKGKGSNERWTCDKRVPYRHIRSLVAVPTIKLLNRIAIYIYIDMRLSLGTSKNENAFKETTLLQSKQILVFKWTNTGPVLIVPVYVNGRWIRFYYHHWCVCGYWQNEREEINRETIKREGREKVREKERERARASLCVCFCEIYVGMLYKGIWDEIERYHLTLSCHCSHSYHTWNNVYSHLPVCVDVKYPCDKFTINKLCPPLLVVSIDASESRDCQL